jgi:capsular polysaccharide biosynthesis protein
MLPENANESLLRYILTTIKKNIIVIIIFTAFVGAISFFYSKYFIIPEYESSATMIIVMETDSEVDYDDVAFSKNLVDTYVIILKNDAFLQKVIDELSLSSDTESLYDSITINGLRNTEVLSLTVRDTDPAKAKAIADKITELAPAEISRTVRAGSIEIVNPAGEAHLVSPD